MNEGQNNDPGATIIDALRDSSLVACGKKLKVPGLSLAGS